MGAQILGQAGDANLAEWFSAIGTVAAATIALVLAGGRPLLLRWRRPRLNLTLGEKEPFARLARPIDRHEAVPYLRLRVSNEGRSDAHHVRVFATRWWAKADGGQSYDWVEQDIDPVLLHWCSLPLPENGQPVAEITLVRGMADLVDLASYQDGELRLHIHDARPRGFNLRSNYPLAEQRLEIVVTGDHANALKTIVAFRFDPKRFFVDVRETGAPHGVVQHVGLLNLLAGPPQTVALTQADLARGPVSDTGAGVATTSDYVLKVRGGTPVPGPTGPSGLEGSRASEAARAADSIGATGPSGPIAPPSSGPPGTPGRSSRGTSDARRRDEA